MPIERPLSERILIKLSLLFLVVAVLILAKEILIPLTVAVFFTFLLLPVSGKLERWGIPRSVAIIISIVIAILVFGAFIYFLYYQAVSFASDWPLLQQGMEDKIARLQHFLREQFNISKREQMSWVNTKVKETVSSGDQIIVGLFSATTGFVANLALIPIYIFFLTFYKERVKQFVAMIAGTEHENNVLEIIKKVSNVSQMYLKGIFFDVLILSVLNSVGFLLLDIKHAILFGVLAAVLNIIPYIGVLIGSILPVLMALLTKDEIGYAIGALGVCVFVQFLDNNFITPYVVGSSVSINPLTAMIALVSCALMWDLPGMVLCIPLTGMLKVVCDNVDELKPYGFLMGEQKDPSGQKLKHSKLLKKLKRKAEAAKD